MQFSVTLGKRLLLLLFIFVIGFITVSVVSTFTFLKFGCNFTPAVRIITVIQDLLMFIFPAVITALLITRQPAELLAVNKRPPFMPLLFGILALVFSIPAMNFLICLNESLPLPDDLAATLRAMEDNAAEMVIAMQGPHTVPNLIMSILIVSIFAGLSEEILFRGAFQRIMVTGGVNAHAAIWISAIIFSAMHMQFFGFFPRMLLGALFGYTLWWTRSLWVPIILHAFNNGMYVVSEWINNGNEAESTSFLNDIGTGDDLLLNIASVAVTAVCLWLARKSSMSIGK